MLANRRGFVYIRDSNKTVGDCPNFAEASEQNGAVPFSETVLLEFLNLLGARSGGAVCRASHRQMFRVVR